MHNSEHILVLGTAQDGGYPQAGCQAECCTVAWDNPALQRRIASLAILSGNQYWLIDITPNFRHQLHLIESHLHTKYQIAGIFITHAHMGHYLGLLELGLEVINSHDTSVYVMPEMKSFLENNAPFSQLIELNNIKLHLIENDMPLKLNEKLSIIPFKVPHRNEFSETVGYKIQSLDKSLVYISDIDSWEKWDMDINAIIRENDILLLDGTFYSPEEILNRNVKDVPHPFIKDSLKKFSTLEEIDRNKVYFTHLNHTNPAIHNSSSERLIITQNCCHVAEDGMIFNL